MKTGIYKITNWINGKFYVGSAVDIIDRWRLHKCSLFLNKHHSIKLQRAWNKYGADNFKFETIEECEKENLIDREQYYIDLYDSYNNGYNCRPTAGNMLGFKFSKESIKRLSESHIGQIAWNKGKSLESVFDKIKSDEIRDKIKQARANQIFSEESKNKMSNTKKGKAIYNHNPNKVFQYDLENNFIKEWENILSLRKTNFDADKISDVCRGKRKTHGGYKWAFK